MLPALTKELQNLSYIDALPLVYIALVALDYGSFEITIF